MAAKGRKRKAGPRYPSGELKRDAIDKGTPELRLQRALGTGRITSAELAHWTAGRVDEALKTLGNPSGDGVDAVGRAYSAGFLVDEQITGAALRDSGRVLFKLYWSHYSELRGMSTSALYRAMVGAGVVQGGGGGDQRDHLEGALNERLGRVEKLGRDVRRAVESLCIDHHFDAGPAWLDRLIASKACDAAYRTEDWAMMQLAVRGLVAIA